MCGCSSTFQPSYAHESRTVEPVGNAAEIQRLDLRKYDVVTVEAFGVDPDNGIDPICGKRFAAEVFGRLKHDFGNLFPEVRFGEPAGKPNELIVTGIMKAYAEFNFETILILRDGTTQQTIFTADVKELGGYESWLRLAMAVDQKSLKAAAAIANTIARGRGWNPDGQPPEATK